MGETYHVVPIDDLIGHDDDGDDCVCGPHIQFFVRGCVVVHHALDGRHADEPEWPIRRAAEVAVEEALDPLLDTSPQDPPDTSPGPS